MTFNPQPKTGKPKNGTKAGRAHMEKVARLPCLCCDMLGIPQDGRTYVHHCRSGGQLKDDFKTVPLCHFHHQGYGGYHTNKRAWEKQFGFDIDWLDWVAARI